MPHGPKNTMRVKHPAAALLDADGVFEITSPSGEVFCVTCQKGVGMSFSRIPEGRRKARASASWHIRRHPNSNSQRGGAGRDGRRTHGPKTQGQNC